METRVLLQRVRMCQQLDEVVIRIVAWPPPRTDEARDASVRRLIHLLVDDAIVAGVVLRRWQVRHMATTPVGPMIPHVVKREDWLIVVNGKRNNNVLDANGETTKRVSTARPCAQCPSTPHTPNQERDHTEQYESNPQRGTTGQTEHVAKMHVDLTSSNTSIHTSPNHTEM